MNKKNALLCYRFLFLSVLLSCVHYADAQAPALLNYQGVARNAAGVPLLNQSLSLRVNIRMGTASGQVVYSETRVTQTNSYGLFSVQIGSAGASSSTGTLAAVGWASGSMFMELELDPAGGSSFVNLGTTQLLSVPYALSALTAAPNGAAGGDLSGTYPNPSIANNAILTSKLGDLSVTDSKIAGVSGSKVTGDITGNAGNVTGIVAIGNGGTGATSAAQARINLGINNSSLAIREVADEFTATAAQALFTLSQPPGANSKVKMYINGIRISSTAYTVSGAVLTYAPANNGNYVLSANDRIQFDYYY